MTFSLVHHVRALLLLAICMVVVAAQDDQPQPKPKPKPMPTVSEPTTPTPRKTTTRKRATAKPATTTPVAPAKPAAAETTKDVGAGPASLLIETDLDCTLKLDGERVGTFKAGEPRKVKTILGQHILEAVSLDGQYCWRHNLSLDKVGQVIVQPELLAQKQAAITAESSRREAAQQEARLQQIKASEAQEMARYADRARRDGFVQIPSGSFTMGDSSDGPAHKVIITNWFEIGKYEVKQAQWRG